MFAQYYPVVSHSGGFPVAGKFEGVENMAIIDTKAMSCRICEYS